ncbi:Cas10/Cmr2 second palm domain-containing protein [Thermoflexus hugenholtzii]
MSDYILMAGDVDAIREYVFETSSLPQIRGGSELLQECEEEIRKRYGSYVLYCGGGSFLLQVPPSEVERIRREIEHIYLKQTLVATVTIVYEQHMPPSEEPRPKGSWAQRIRDAAARVPLDGGFAQRMLFLNTCIREAKRQKTIAPFYEAFPFGKRCERCGKRMTSAREPMEDGKALCLVCKYRDNKGRKREGEIRGKFNQEFWDQYGKNRTADQPEDLDHLVASARRKYLAFFYADGNDIGGLLQKAESPEEYKQISQALKQGTQEALFESLEAVCGTALDREEYWPFDIINIGGDDVTVLIQAGYAWDLAVEFLKCFEDEVSRRLPENLEWRPTASCGILIADAKYPVRYMERLATDLLKRAKKRAKEDPKNPKSAIDFLWLPSPVASDRVEPLLSIYRRGEGVELTARPYTLDEAQRIRELIPQVARWPRTTRHRWAEALERGVFQSLSFIQYDIARERGGKEKIAALEQVGEILNERGGRLITGLRIWQQTLKNQTVIWHTPLLDILELAELRAMRPDVEEEEGI